MLVIFCVWNKSTLGLCCFCQNICFIWKVPTDFDYFPFEFSFSRSKKQVNILIISIVFVTITLLLQINKYSVCTMCIPLVSILCTAFNQILAPSTHSAFNVAVVPCVCRVKNELNENKHFNVMFSNATRERQIESFSLCCCWSRIVRQNPHC